MSNWFPRHRQEWIAESVKIFGFINREHICAKFGVSVQQASTDIRETLGRFPGLMEYSKSQKQYIRSNAP